MYPPAQPPYGQVPQGQPQYPQPQYPQPQYPQPPYQQPPYQQPPAAQNPPGQAPGYPGYPGSQAPQASPAYPYGYGQAPAPRPGIPTPVKAAAVLMYIGAGLEVLDAILALVGGVSGIYQAIGAAFIAGLWIWLAVKSRAGRNWARITGTILFALDTIFLVVVIRFSTALAAAGASLNWVLGLVCVILLWQRSCSPFFSRASAGYNYPGYPNYPA